MVARAGISPIRPWPTKEVTSIAVALLLCTMAVTRIPAINASQRLDMFCPMTWRKLEP